MGGTISHARRLVKFWRGWDGEVMLAAYRPCGGLR